MAEKHRAIRDFRAEQRFAFGPKEGSREPLINVESVGLLFKQHRLASVGKFKPSEGGGSGSVKPQQII